jgi:hypothetical protein
MITLISLGFADISLGLVQVPDVLKPNPTGLARPPHLGAEWPSMNPDEKLYSLKFELLRDGYQKWALQHTVEVAPKDPNLKDQFEICNYKVIPPDYYGEEPVEDYHQPFIDVSPCLSGGTGLIDIPSAFTLKKGVMVASLIVSKSSGGASYLPELYQKFDSIDIGTSFSYGYRDDIELTFTATNLSREIDYTSGLQTDDSNLIFGIGGKASFGTWAENFQMAGGFHFSVYEDKDRDNLLDTDYETLSTLYAVISTDEKNWNGHVTWKYQNYSKGSSVPYHGHVPGDGADSGLAPAQANWGELCFGLEYKIPDTKYRVISEFIKSEITWGSEDKSSYNLAVQADLPKMSFKLYSRKINQESRDELGLISTYFF